MRKSDERLEVSREQYHVRREGEEHARHVMGAVPWIELGVIISVLVCGAVALVLLLG